MLRKQGPKEKVLLLQGGRGAHQEHGGDHGAVFAVHDDSLHHRHRVPPPSLPILFLDKYRYYDICNAINVNTMLFIIKKHRTAPQKLQQNFS